MRTPQPVNVHIVTRSGLCVNSIFIFYLKIALSGVESGLSGLYVRCDGVGR